MIKNGLYNVIAALIRLLIGTITIPLLIRLIGVESYGLWTIIFSVINLIVLAEVGLSTSTTVFVSQDISNAHGNVGETIVVTMGLMSILALLAVIILFFGSSYITILFPKLTQKQSIIAVLSIKIGAIAIWARLLQQVLVGFLQAYQLYKTVNLISTFQVTFINIGMVVIAGLGGNVTEMMICYTVGNIGSLFAYSIISYKLVISNSIRFRWNYIKMRSIIHYSISTWFVSIGGKLFSQGDRIIIGAILGTDALGVYAAITNITVQINSLSSLIVQPLLPLLSAFWDKSNELNRKVLEKRIEQAIQLNSLFALGLGAFFLGINVWLINIIFSQAPDDSYTVAFSIAVIIYSLYSVNAVGYYTLLGIGSVKICLAVTLGSGIISLLMIALGAEFVGLTGAIIGNAGYLGTFLLTYLAMQKLSINIAVWIRWFRLPLIWFLVVVLTDVMLYNHDLTKFGAITFEILLFNCWFLFAQREHIQPYVGSIAAKLKA